MNDSVRQRMTRLAKWARRYAILTNRVCALAASPLGKRGGEHPRCLPFMDGRYNPQCRWSRSMIGDVSTPLLTIDEVRSRLNVSVSTVRRLVRDGKLRAYRVGGRLRFKPEE